MTITREHLEDALRPLRLLNALSETKPLCFEALNPDEIPAPYHALLVHQRDMTQTLQDYHGDGIHLEVLRSIHQGSTYLREVTLTLDAAQRPVEYGAICLFLDRFSPSLRDDILANKRPLGALLAQATVSVSHAPGPFFKVTPDHNMFSVLGINEACTLYGRCNTIRNAKGDPIAQVIEILPPAQAKRAPAEKGAQPR
ncbi:MAG: hypothetical protein O3C57_06100 [Verrucomicrobia bacterium]|nr:hypothetical protein [Verrucomicrobiota bacterium]